MPKEDLIPYQQNLAFKRAFKRLQLNLEEVMVFTPFDLDLENLRLESLLDFVRQYQQYGSQKAMEVVAGRYLFPPIFPGISPESDWYRFEQWMRGLPVRQKLSEQLPKTLLLRKPEEISEEEIEAEFEKLVNALEVAGYGLCLNDDIPARLQYAFLYEELGETFELHEKGGGWFFDGCSGFCPGCFQRPWCSTGESSYWPEDEKAGKIYLIDELKDYVSPSPQSFEILKNLQAEKDASLEAFKAERPDKNMEDDQDWKAKLN